jgi:hypothetical protein
LLYPIKEHATKTYKEEEAQLHAFLKSARNESMIIVNTTYRPFYHHTLLHPPTPRKSHRYPLDRKDEFEN